MHLNGMRVFAVGALVCAIAIGCKHAQKKSVENRKIASADFVKEGTWMNLARTLSTKNKREDLNAYHAHLSGQFSKIEKICETNSLSDRDKARKVVPILKSLRKTLDRNAPNVSMMLENINAELVKAENHALRALVNGTTQVSAPKLTYSQKKARESIAAIGSAASTASSLSRVMSF